MALGFQRIHDMSPLSIKQLNDQLEQLWKKVMGGLTTQDMVGDVAGRINAAVTQGQFTSMIEQTAESIKLMAGSGAADNLLRNGDGSFATEGWAAQAAVLSVVKDEAMGNCFALSGAGTMVQSGVKLKAGARYTLCFSFLCAQGARGEVPAHKAYGDALTGAAWTDYKMSFTPETGGAADVVLRLYGAGRVAQIALAQGDGGTWRQNPNEIHNSSIVITDERVQIGTQNFSLELYNERGEAVTQMSADAQGFSKLYVADNIMLRGRPMYLGEGEHHLWVHPDAPRGGGQIFSAAGEPALAQCYAGIQAAIDALPRWCDGDVTVHVKEMGAWQYPAPKLVIANFFGGGSIMLAGWGIEHFIIKSLEVKNNSLLTYVVRADINACGSQDHFSASCATVWMSNCRVNGRNLLLGVGGFDAAHGALMILTACEAHNCQYAVSAQAGGRIYVEDGAGGGNAVGCFAYTGGTIQQSHSTFGANKLYWEMDGGKVLTPSTISKAGYLPVNTPMEYVATFSAVRTAAYLGPARWATAPDWPRVGGKQKGVVWFDTVALRAALKGKRIQLATLTLWRRGAGGRPSAVEIALEETRTKTPASVLLPGAMRGAIGRFAWGEKRTCPLPLTTITNLVSGACEALVLSAQEEAAFAGMDEGGAVLQIVYR